MTGGRLAGRSAIVTGAAHGLGRVYAERFAAEGAAVAVLDLDLPAAQVVADRLRSQGARAVAVQVDISDEASVASAVASAEADIGGIDILVNNAAIMGVVPMARVGFEHLSVNEWHAMLSVNVIGTWLMCRAVAPGMRERGYGKIVNVGSTSAMKGVRTQIHYVSSKAALQGFTRSLARELGEAGVTVNLVAPGSTLTEEDPDADVVSLRRAGVDARAIRRVQYPEDVVGAVLFLCSDDSAFITGQTIVVDGGGVMS